MKVWSKDQIGNSQCLNCSSENSRGKINLRERRWEWQDLVDLGPPTYISQQAIEYQDSLYILTQVCCFCQKNQPFFHTVATKKSSMHGTGKQDIDVSEVYLGIYLPPAPTGPWNNSWSVFLQLWRKKWKDQRALGERSWFLLKSSQKEAHQS